MLKGEDDHGGTGFQVQATNGPVIITNSHVCERSPKDGRNILVIKGDEEMKRKILKIDDAADLCVVEGWPKDPGLTLGKDTKVGQKVMEIGHPGLGDLKVSEGEVTDTVNVEILHHVMPTGQKGLDKMMGITNEPCKGPKFKILKKDMPLMGIFSVKNVPLCFVVETDAIKTDVPTFPGNSGSPLLDKQGKVVGVIFATDGEENGYAVNLDHLKSLLKNF